MEERGGVGEGVGEVRVEEGDWDLVVKFEEGGDVEGGGDEVVGGVEEVKVEFWW